MGRARETTIGQTDAFREECEANDYPQGRKHRACWAPASRRRAKRFAAGHRATWVVLAVVLAPGPLLAQSDPQEITEPRLPENAQSPTDYQGPARPIQAPATDNAGAQSAESTDTRAAEGYSGGDLILERGDRVRLGSGSAAPAKTGATHIVVKGDTLWGICERYFGDPWRWPDLWSQNPQIKNPHLIYPGDTIHVRPGSGVVRIGGNQRRPQSQSAGLIRSTGGQRSASGPVMIQQNAFVDPEEHSAAGKIVGSKVDHSMLTVMDEIYLGGGTSFKPKPGDIYTAYERVEPLRDGGRTIGHLVRILGTMRVKRVSDKGVATAEITRAVRVIERGAFVGKLRRTLRRLAVRPAEKNVEGSIIAHTEPTVNIGADALVVVNRGKKDGVNAGNRFLVVRRGDGNTRIYHDDTDDNTDFPYEAIAEVSVLEAKEHASVGVVTRTLRELHRGDKVQLRLGY